MESKISRFCKATEEFLALPKPYAYGLFADNKQSGKTLRTIADKYNISVLEFHRHIKIITGVNFDIYGH